MNLREVRSRTLILAVTVGFVALSLLVAMVVLRQVLAADTAEVTDRSMRTQSQELARQLADTTASDRETTAELAARVLGDYAEAEVVVVNKSFLVVVDGDVLAQVGPRLDGLFPSIAELAGLADDGVALADGGSALGPLRLLARPVEDRAADSPFGDAVVIVAFPVEDQQTFLDRAFRDGIVVAAGTLAVVAPLVWLAAGWMLRPIERLAETAQDITATATDQRLTPQGTAEVAHLIDSFNAMVDRLEEAVREQRRFLNDASHELRTPLTVMRGHLEVARSDPDKASRATGVALTELDRMGRIVDDLLVLARAGQIGFLRIGPVDSDDFLSSIHTRVSGMSDHRWVIEAMPLGVFHADSQRLDQVMLNLCVNAARHTPAGGEIAIGAELATDRFRMWVRDTGQGIDESEQEAIFERFRRGSEPASGTGLASSSGTAVGGGGAGLGLSIVRAIAEAHGGSVTVVSALGAGATFTVSIPVQTPTRGT